VRYRWDCGYTYLYTLCVHTLLHILSHTYTRTCTHTHFPDFKRGLSLSPSLNLSLSHKHTHSHTNIFPSLGEDYVHPSGAIPGQYIAWYCSVLQWVMLLFNALFLVSRVTNMHESCDFPRFDDPSLQPEFTLKVLAKICCLGKVVFVWEALGPIGSQGFSRSLVCAHVLYSFIIILDTNGLDKWYAHQCTHLQWLLPMHCDVLNKLACSARDWARGCRTRQTLPRAQAAANRGTHLKNHTLQDLTPSHPPMLYYMQSLSLPHLLD